MIYFWMVLICTALPSSTVVRQNICLGQQVSISFMVSSIWPQLKQLQTQSQLSITNRKSSNSWEISGLRRHLDSTWPWFSQCTPLVHQKDPILLTRCQHRSRSGLPPLSGQSNPSLLRDLEKNNTIKKLHKCYCWRLPSGSIFDRNRCSYWFT